MRNSDTNPDKLARNIQLGLTIAFSILLLIFLIAGLYSFVGPTTPTEKKDFVQVIAILLAGIVGIVGLFFTWQNVRTNQRALLHNQKVLEANQQNTQQTLELTEQGQTTERFSRAIEQLGATDNEGKPKLEIRLGGIYALERIDTDTGGYYFTAIDILCAYIRENAPRSREAADETDKQTSPVELVKPPSDIQAILNLFGRRKPSEEIELEKPLNLIETNLRGALLAQGYFVNSVLSRSDLRQTLLHGADLGNSTFYQSNLRNSLLPNANLQGAILSEADLSGSYLEEADLRGAVCTQTNLQSCILKNANLQAASFTGANFWGADLAGANLSEASLTGVDLNHAVLLNANFQGTDLAGADLELALGVTQEQLEQALGDANTKLSVDLRVPASWSDRTI